MSQESSVKQWWDSLPKIDKMNIVDYKFTDYTWEDLNDIDKQLIELEMKRRSGGTQA